MEFIDFLYTNIDDFSRISYQPLDAHQLYVWPPSEPPGQYQLCFLFPVPSRDSSQRKRKTGSIH